MLAQPGVPFGDGGDTFGHEILEGIYLLAWDQADAALRNEGLGDGRGPTAGPYDAYVDGHFVAYSVVERVAEDTVALLLQLAQVLEDGDKLFQRRDTLVADGGVGRAAADLQPEHERPTLGRHEGETGRLGDDGGVGAVPAQDGRECAKSPVLLPYSRCHGDVAAQPETEVTESVERDEVGDESTLHVAGAASVEQIALQVARVWIPSPRGRIARIHGVGVGVEQDGASVPCPSPCAGHVRSILVIALFPDVIAVRFRFLARRLPRIYVEAALREGALDDRPHSTLFARDRTDAHKLLQQVHHDLAPGLYGAAYGLCESVVELCHVSRPPFLFPVMQHRSMRLFSRLRPACLTRWRCVISIDALEQGFEREDPVQRDVVPS